MIYPSGMTPEHDAIKRLFPDLSPEEQQEAAENLARYLRTIVALHESIRSDPERYRRFKALTHELKATTIETERSNITNQPASERA